MKYLDNNMLVLQLTNEYNHSDKTMWVTRSGFSHVKYWMKDGREKATPFIAVPLLIQTLQRDLDKIDSLLGLDRPEDVSSQEIGAELFYCDEYHDVNNPLNSIRTYIISMIKTLEEFTHPYELKDLVYDSSKQKEIYTDEQH